MQEDHEFQANLGCMMMTPCHTTGKNELAILLLAGVTHMSQVPHFASSFKLYVCMHTIHMHIYRYIYVYTQKERWGSMC